MRDPNADNEADSTLFTRAGNFGWNAQGQLVTSEGFVVQGDNGDILMVA